jgi:hypothetical protein
MHTESDQLNSLNSDNSLDASALLNSHISDDENISQFFQTHIQSTYHDLNSFILAYRHSSQPLILSINIQSLTSKYEHLKIFVQTLLTSHVPIDAILLQETWDIKYPHLLNMPGFQNIVYKTRTGMRVGGVGIYIRNGLNFKERKDLENNKLKPSRTWSLKSYIQTNH